MTSRILTAAALAFVVAGCGDDSSSSGAGGGGQAAATTSSTAETGATTTAGQGGGDGTGGAGNGGAGGAGGAAFDACAPPTESACGTDAGMIRGVARLAEGMTPPDGTAGRLVIGLMHARFGKEDRGGHPHWYEVVSDVDLADGPVPFEIDMCGGGTAMWSEDNCEFNLVVLLDTNGNAGAQSNQLVVLPDAGELGWHRIFNLSCNGESPCMDVELGCVGPDCVTFEPLGECACAPETCDSDTIACR